MSRFTVCRSWSGYCLLLDDDRIAGGKPDYHEGNVIYEWRTRDNYGPVDELKAENAKLREERDTYRDLVGMMDHPDLNVQLQAENAKLRELVRELYEDQCDECDRWKYRDRILELGIEVDA